MVVHRVYFFQSDAALVKEVTAFTSSGLQAGEPVIVIATAARVAALRSQMSALGTDPQTAVDQGNLRFFDAHAMIDQLLLDGTPDRERFHAHVRSVLQQAGADGEPVRIYQEVVDVLWRRGLQPAALLLEEMWDQMETTPRLALLCAYATDNFHGRPGSDGLRRICALHRAGLHWAEGSTPDPSMLALEALVEQARATDEFIAMLTRELREPLAPIQSALQVMRLRGDTGVTRERKIADHQVGNLIRLFDDLRDASRIATGTIELQHDRLDLADAIEVAVEIAAPALYLQGQALQVRAARGVAFVDGDAVRLTQVVSILLSNAAKYSERGGRISLDLDVSGGQVVVSVQDQGIGIEADLLPRVFERGVQGQHGIGGLGLGLAIARSLVELHGGVITAHSGGPGRGSELRVTLPLAAPRATGALAARSEPARDPAAPKRLLIVDDDLDLANTLAELLAGRGFVTRVARGGEEAILAFAELRPQAALIDISLPQMSGLDLARRLREIGPDAKLIALSGFGRREDVAASLASGFDIHLVKPVRVDVIEAHLRIDGA